MGVLRMSKCVFLSTYDENIECSKDCALYNWTENDNKCPFTELKSKGKRKRNIYEYDFYKDEKEASLSMIYSENYL